MPYCPVCLGSISEGASVCDWCGYKVSYPAEQPREERTIDYEDIERKVRELLEDKSSVKISEVIAAIPEYKKEEKKFVKAALRKLGFRDGGYGIWTKQELQETVMQREEEPSTTRWNERREVINRMAQASLKDGIREFVGNKDAVRTEDIVEVIPAGLYSKKEKMDAINEVLTSLGYTRRKHGIWTKPGKSAFNLTFVVYSNKKYSPDDKELLENLVVEFAAGPPVAQVRRAYGKLFVKMLSSRADAFVIREEEKKNGKVVKRIIPKETEEIADFKYDNKDNQAKLKEYFTKQALHPNFRMIALGGGNEIGRSCYYVKVGNHYVILDAGIKQGEDVGPGYSLLDFLPKPEAVFISHSHADHIGTLKDLLKRIGKEIPVIATDDTKKQFANDLTDLVNKKLLSAEERDGVLARVQTSISGELAGGLKFFFQEAGHIAGSGMIYLESDGDSVLYTGDINFEQTRFQQPARPLENKVRTLITEATYAGEPEREAREDRERKLVQAVADLVSRGKNVLLPVFAKGRAEEVVDILDKAITSGSIGKCNAYVVGLAAKQAEELGHANWVNFTVLGKTEIVEKYDEETGEYVQKEIKPDMVSLTYQLKEIMVGQNACPALVVCGQGFLSAGTSAQLVSDVMSRENCAIIRTGYTPPGSAGDILTRAKTEDIKVLDSPVVVKCDVLYVPLSAHATQSKLVDFIRQQKPENVIVVHSEPNKAGRFIDALYDIGYKGQAVYAENFRVIFRNGILGLKYYDEELAKETRKEIQCECGFVFYDESSAKDHSAREGHKLLEPYEYYIFSIRVLSGKPERKNVKGAFYGIFEKKLKFDDVFYNPDAGLMYVRGKLSEDDRRIIEEKFTTTGNAKIAVQFLSIAKAYHGVPRQNVPIILSDIMKRMGIFIGRDVGIVAPYYREMAEAPEGIAGLYDFKRNMIQIPFDRISDEEDLKVVLAHETAHYIHRNINHKIQKEVEDFDKKTDLEKKQFLLFFEGFAQYAVEKIGMSSRLLSIYHEVNTPDYYYTGRKMYKMIEYAFGKELAVSIALDSNTTDFFVAYHRAVSMRYEIITQAAERLLPILKKAKIYRRWFLFWHRFDKKFEEGMLEYISNHYSEKLNNEFSGWPEKLVRMEALYSTMADYVLMKLGNQEVERRMLMDALVYFAKEDMLKKIRKLMMNPSFIFDYMQ